MAGRAQNLEQAGPLNAPQDSAQRAKRKGTIRWTKRMRAEFLDTLAATCNVKQAAAATGASSASLYRLRRTDAKFAAEWADALALGYQMLETHVLGHILAGQSGDGQITLGLEGAETPLDFTNALKLLTTHRNASGKPHRGGIGRQFAKPEETDAALQKRLAQIARRVAQREDAVLSGQAQAGDTPEQVAQ